MIIQQKRIFGFIISGRGLNFNSSFTFLRYYQNMYKTSFFSITIRKQITAQNTEFTPDFQVYKFSEFWAIHPKIWRNSAFSQSFHTKKFDEITVFYAVKK